MVKIYVLINPFNNEVRYIGVTKKSLSRRLSSHIYDAKRLVNHRTKWINSILKQNRKPLILCIDTVETPKEAYELEKFYISKFKEYNFNLVNATIGGEGALGRICTDLHRKNITDAHKKKKVVQYSLIGEKLETFRSIQEASRILKIPATKIVACCKGRRRKTSNFQFKYNSDNIDFCVLPEKKGLKKLSLQHRNKAIRNLKGFKESWIIKDE